MEYIQTSAFLCKTPYTVRADFSMPPIGIAEELLVLEGRRQKAEGRRQKAEGKTAMSAAFWLWQTVGLSMS
jgi:hypothetical protein